MKRQLIPLLLVFLGLSLAISCKKDETTAPVNPLIGSWTFTSSVKTACTDPLNNFSDICTTSCPTLAITASGWTVTIPGQPTESGTYTTSGTTITLTPPPSGTTGVFTYAVVGTTLTLTKEAGADGCIEVTTFTKI